MKTNRATHLAAGAFVVLASINTYAQSSQPTEASVATAASSAKEMKAANRALQKAVIRALTKTKGLRASLITVRAKDGAVTLEGTVPEQSQMEMAMNAAKGVPGVTSVKNSLTLSTE